MNSYCRVIHNPYLSYHENYHAKIKLYVYTKPLKLLSPVLFVAVYSVIESFRTVHASRVIHQKMLTRILHAPMGFFDTTPVGRIVNRFSKDINTIDTELPLTFLMTLDTFCVVLSTLIVISYSTPYFLVAILPLAALYIFIQVGGLSYCFKCSLVW